MDGQQTGTVQNNTEAKNSCPVDRSRSLIQVWLPEPVLRSGTEDQGRVWAPGEGPQQTDIGTTRPLKRTLGSGVGEPMQGRWDHQRGGSCRWTQGQLDTRMTDPRYS